MSRPPEKPLPDTLQAWGEKFVSVAAEQPPVRRWSAGRSVLAGIAIVAATGGVAMAATGFDFDPEQTDVIVAKPGRTIAYMDLSTNEPIRCPDGSLLTSTVTSVSAPEAPAECADGSVPRVFTEQSIAFDEWLQQQPFGTALKDGPNFAFVLSDRDPSGD